MNFPTRQTMMTFVDIAKHKECFYKVRLNAIERLAKVIECGVKQPAIYCEIVKLL